MRFPLRHVRHAAVVALAGAFVVAARAQTADETVPAMIPVEVLPVDPSLATGALWLDGARWSKPSIALQPARAAAGIAVEESRNDARVYVLTLLGEVERNSDGALQLDVAADARAWCEITKLGKPLAECFQDVDEDGMLETALTGVLGTAEPLSLNRVGARQAIDALAYRAALPEELPQFQVGYESCASEVGEAITSDSELRYSTVIHHLERLWSLGPPPSVCEGLGRLVETRDNGDSVVQFGRFTVLLHREGEEVTTTLLEGIAPGTYLGHLRADKPLTDATDSAARASAQEAQKPFLYFVSAPTLEIAEVRIGGEILAAEVAHGITGTLAVEADGGGRGAKKIIIPAGTPLYGAAMSMSLTPASFDPTIVWCAPRLDDDNTSHCFAGGQLVKNFMPYVVRSLSLDSMRYVAAPVVERGPVDFGAPLFLTLRLDSVERKNVLLSFSVAPLETPAWAGMRLRRGDDGAGLLAIGGALLEVAPAQDGMSAAVRRLGEFEEGADAVPYDAGALLR